MSGVFSLYELVKPNYKKSYDILTSITRQEYQDIQHNKLSSINKNYMLNDQISNKFYNALGITKENLRSLINKYITSTKNFDSLDPNNIMLMFLMRYSNEVRNETMFYMVYEIFLYKNFYPIFTKYFKYGVDESAFEYFKSTLGSKYELSKQESLYATVDVIGKRNIEKYKPSIIGNSEKDFLLLPVNTKTRLNQFTKELMKAYMPFIEKNKVHLNASRELEDEEGGTFNDQTSNNNKLSHDYKNKLLFSIMHDSIPQQLRYNLLNNLKKSTKEDIDKVYNNIIMNKYISDDLINIFVENTPKNRPIEDKQSITFWMEELNKHKPDDYVLQLDKYIEKYTPELDISQKSLLIEKRKMIILMLYMLLLKNLHK